MDCNCEIFDQTEDVDNVEFYFESDHLALRGNPDYTAVLRTLTVLEAQRIQATKDLEKLAILKKTALDDPLKFIQELKENDQIESIPGLINIAEIPKIDLEKYNVTFPNFEKDNLNREKENESNCKMESEDRRDTFNQPWTSEEQRRLEQLLIDYPPEQFEMRRFAKISKALGNRTTKQVSSRVQKFFKKLHSAGMPIPGRIPKSQRNTRVYRFNRLSFRPSTFFPAHDVPVTMPEDETDMLINNPRSVTNSVTSFDKDNKTEEMKIVSIDSHSDDSDVEEAFGKVNSETIILKLLERIKKDKEKDVKLRAKSIHRGYKCNQCSEEPINGTRWHCKTCVNKSFDYCTDCLVAQLFSNDAHPIHHKFIGLRILKMDLERTNFDIDSDTDQNQDMESELGAHYDKDYMMSKFTKNEQYNYLDPNFLP